METTSNRKRFVSGDPNNYEPSVYGLGSFVPADALKSEVGDLIEIDRTLYTDWVLNDGDGYVIHVSGAKGENIPTGAKGVVRRDKLTNVARFNAVRVNNKLVCAKERSLQPLPVQETLTKARNSVGTAVNFDFFKNNSEFYLTQWKFGYGWSDQASMAINVIKSLGCNRNNGQQLLQSLTAILKTPPSLDPYGHLYRDRKRRSSSTPPVILLTPSTIIPGPVIPKYNSSSRPNSGRTTPCNLAA